MTKVFAFTGIIIISHQHIKSLTCVSFHKKQNLQKSV